MPQRVTWRLQYPTRSEDQLNVMRHHFETFRLDPNVRSVMLEDSTEIPHSSTMIVDFEEDHDQPATRELQYMDRRFHAWTNARVEHEIHVEPATMIVPSIAGNLRFVAPHIRGRNVAADIQEVGRQLAAGTTHGAARGGGGGSGALTPDGTFGVANAAVGCGGGGGAGGGKGWHGTPYEAPKKPEPKLRTAWERVLEDED
jgi:hypothetical protein